LTEGGYFSSWLLVFFVAVNVLTNMANHATMLPWLPCFGGDSHAADRRQSPAGWGQGATPLQAIWVPNVQLASQGVICAIVGGYITACAPLHNGVDLPTGRDCFGG